LLHPLVGPRWPVLCICNLTTELMNQPFSRNSPRRPSPCAPSGTMTGASSSTRHCEGAPRHARRRGHRASEGSLPHRWCIQRVRRRGRCRAPACVHITLRPVHHSVIEVVGIVRSLPCRTHVGRFIAEATRVPYLHAALGPAAISLITSVLIIFSR
jgi:hypothetical protein